MVKKKNTDFFVNLVFAHQKYNSPYQYTYTAFTRTSVAKYKSLFFEGNLGIRNTKFQSKNFNIQLSHSIGLSYNKFGISFFDEYVKDDKLWIKVDIDEQYPVIYNLALNSGILFNYNVYKKIGIGLQFTYALNYRFQDGFNSAAIKAEYFEEDGSSNRIELNNILQSNRQKRVFLSPIFKINLNYNI